MKLDIETQLNPHTFEFKFEIVFGLSIPLSTSSGLTPPSPPSSFSKVRARSIFSPPTTIFKCMIKIPPSLGDQNINLTMDYLQEERGSNSKFQKKKKCNKVCFTGFGFFLFLKLIPSHKQSLAMVFAKQTNLASSQLVFVSILELPWELPTSTGLSLGEKLFLMLP